MYKPIKRHSLGAYGYTKQAARRRCGKPKEPAGLGLDTTRVVLEIRVPFRV